MIHSYRRLGLVLLVASLALWPARQAARGAPNAEPLPSNAVVETYVADAGGYVVAMAFAPDGRLFYTTKGGFSDDQVAEVRVVSAAGTLRSTPFLRTNVNTDGEQGLLGITLDPDFATNHYVYIYKTAPATTATGGRVVNKVVRFTEDPATQTAVAGSARTLLSVPRGEADAGATNHNGGNIHFKGDKLFVTIGEYGARPDNAQNLKNPKGKIHRINRDGSIPSDNPFYGQADKEWSIWSYGHRNSFDFTIDPVSGALFFTENGPSCDDEVNLGKRGQNYGWSASYQCGVVPAGTVAPLKRYSSTIAITGITVYTGGLNGWNNDLFWCANKTSVLYHATLNGSRTALTSVQEVTGAPACSVDVEDGPGGALYVSENNAGSNNSVIKRIRPQ
jgi:glucose/arabinose dehydrogenase